jgi:hypothetical protein
MSVKIRRLYSVNNRLTAVNLELVHRPNLHDIMGKVARQADNVIGWLRRCFSRTPATFKASVIRLLRAIESFFFSQEYQPS